MDIRVISFAALVIIIGQLFRWLYHVGFQISHRSNSKRVVITGSIVSIAALFVVVRYFSELFFRLMQEDDSIGFEIFLSSIIAYIIYYTKPKNLIEKERALNEAYEEREDVISSNSNELAKTETQASVDEEKRLNRILMEREEIVKNIKSKLPSKDN
ncbi:MAG: hypothetical protein RIF36_02680 [Imperialibacter sp.]|uniref:hypothetical protein n=1 Tax=Imperialibacter sp. TaxID=2038411 RepID=UPI0032EC0634